MNMLKTRVLVPKEFGKLKKFSIFIYFVDTNLLEIDKMKEELFNDSYKSFFLNIPSISEIDRRLNINTPTPGVRGNETMVRNNIDYEKLGDLLYYDEGRELKKALYFQKLRIIKEMNQPKKVRFLWPFKFNFLRIKTG